MFLTTAPLSAYDFEVDGIYYNILSEEEKAVEVTYGDIDYSGTIIIPETVDLTVDDNDITYSVTSIGNYAFYECSGLTGITIPESVTSIGDDAFRGCTKLVSLNPIDVGNTKITFSCNNNTSYQCYATESYNYNNDGNLEIFGLKPNKEYRIVYGLLINGIECAISVIEEIKTREPYIQIYYTYDMGVKSVSTEGAFQYDGEILGYTLFLRDQKPTEYDNLNEKTFYNLDPSEKFISIIM